MVKIETRVQVFDNSGVIVGKCIKIYKGSARLGSARLGDLILIAVQRRQPNVVLTSKLYLALVVAQRKSYRRRSGHRFAFDQNGVVLLKDRTARLASRISQPIAREVRAPTTAKVTLLARKVV
jgi:ribosomal protein L14